MDNVIYNKEISVKSSKSYFLKVFKIELKDQAVNYKISWQKDITEMVFEDEKKMNFFC